MIIRKMRLFIAVGLVLVLVAGLTGGAVAAKPEPAGGLRWIVAFDGEVNPTGKEAIIRGAGGVTEMHLEALNMAIISLPDKAAARAIGEERGILRVEEDSYRYYDFDPLPWGINRIDAEWVWTDADGNTGDGVNVAVLDTGIDTDHPDLADNLEGVYSCVNRDTLNVEDRNGHGTHCSGIIAALNNGIGVVGVGPDIDLYAVQISRGTRIKLTDILEGINWCIGTHDDGIPGNDIQVMSMSFGGGYSTSEDIALQDAYNAGIVLVSSAGNASGGAVSYPAALTQVIAVSATDKSDVIASFSSTGDEVELAAPGVSIYSTYLSGSYATMSGTSMAGPHVAGVAALVIATGTITDTNNVYGIADEVRAQLQASAEDIWLPSDQQGYGLVDAENAVLGTTNGNNLAPLATGAITGTVTDADTGNPIEGATVTADGHSTTTASDGTYTLAGLPVDSYTVTASATGYESASQEVTVSADTTTTVDFALSPTTTPTGTMYVADIEMSRDTKIAGRNTFYWAIATVTVIGADGPIEGATVEGHWEAATTDSDSGMTDANGQVSLQSDSVRNPPAGTIFTFVVDSVTKDGWTYDSEVSVTSESITVS